MGNAKQGQKNRFYCSKKGIALICGLLGLTLNAYAQRGVLVIRGEITATTCVIRPTTHLSIGSRADPTGSTDQCDGHEVRTYLNELIVNHNVSDRAIATVEQSER